METSSVEAMRDRTWNRRLLRITWWAALIVVLTELVVFMTMVLKGTVANTAEHLVRFIAFPSVCSVVVLGVVQLILMRVKGRPRHTFNGIVYITGISVICLCIAWTHREVYTAACVFVMPIFLSILFTSRRALSYAFGVCLGLYGAFILVAHVLEPATSPGFGDICTTVALLVVSVLIGHLIQQKQYELIEDTVAALQRSQRDSLTGLYNHATFYEWLDEMILRNAREEIGFSLIVFDIDNFKRINDRYGHDVGDDVLRALVEAISETIDEGDMAFRYGGEEFTVLTANDAQGSVALAEQVREAFVARSLALGEHLKATASAGVSAFDRTRTSGRREFFASADEALYEAKRTGKDRVVLWTNKLLERPD